MKHQENGLATQTLNKKSQINSPWLVGFIFISYHSYPVLYPVLKIRHTAASRSIVSGNFSTRRMSKAACAFGLARPCSQFSKVRGLVRR